MTEPIVQADGVKKYFTPSRGILSTLFASDPEPIQAVDGVDLEINRGEITGLVGESGCGKTTLGRVLLGLLQPTEGEVYFGDRRLTEMSKSDRRSLRKDIQMVFQNPFQTLNPRLTVLDNMLEPLKIHDEGTRDSRRPIIWEALEDVGLDPEEVLRRFPSELSGGQRQRVSIARTFLLEPEFVVADEPVSMLDASIRMDILDLLQGKIEENDAAMLYISHDLSTVGHLCEHMHIMYLGRVVETGPTSDIIEDPYHPYTQLLLQSIPSANPQRQRDRVQIRGEVPSPSNVPTGCRFHTRCPKVIPPDDWEGTQDDWETVFRIRRHLAADDVDVDSARVLASEREDGDPDRSDVVDVLYDDYVDGSLPTSIESDVRESLFAAVDGDEDLASRLVDSAGRTVCEQQDPTLVTEDAERSVACHLY